MKIEGISWTLGQQGGIGYPPQVIKYKGKWYLVEDSRSHGGTICHKCSEARNIQYGYTPQKFNQPKPNGMNNVFSYDQGYYKKFKSKSTAEI